jgi:energy-coupling factor transporter ATP-binding protein EcfA2
MSFTKATKSKQYLRLLLSGPSGSGKTYSALMLAQVLAKKRGSKIAMIDSERGSGSLYANRFQYDAQELQPPYAPENYLAMIDEAVKAGYKIIIVDSISHEWMGAGGILEIQTMKGGRFQDWKDVTPRHRKFIDGLVGVPADIVCTSRTKTEYEVSKGESNKIEVKKVGTKLEQREGMEYEYTVAFRLDNKNIASPEKDRTGMFIREDGKEFLDKITEEVGEEIWKWLNEGKETAQEDTIHAEVEGLLKKMTASNLFSAEEIEKVSKIKSKMGLIAAEKKVDSEIYSRSIGGNK